MMFGCQLHVACCGSVVAPETQQLCQRSLSACPNPTFDMNIRVARVPAMFARPKV